MKVIVVAASAAIDGVPSRLKPLPLYRPTFTRMKTFPCPLGGEL